ncbi:uncharacterized protein ACBR49_007901 [Aulostomus maculatus]
MLLLVLVCWPSLGAAEKQGDDWLDPYDMLSYDPSAKTMRKPEEEVSVTVTTSITELLQHLGQGISVFFRVLLSDVPVTLQTPVLLTVVLSIVVCTYGGVRAALRYGNTVPLRRKTQASPHPQLKRPQPRHQMIEDEDRLAGGEAPRQRAEDGRLQRSQLHRRRPKGAGEEPAKVETLSRQEGGPKKQDGGPEIDEGGPETDEGGPETDEGGPETDEDEQREHHNFSFADFDPQADSDPENDRETQEELAGPGGVACDLTSSVFLLDVEMVGVPVQETSPASLVHASGTQQEEETNRKRKRGKPL